MKCYRLQSRKTYNKKAKYFTHTIDWRVTARLKTRIVERVNLRKGDYVLDIGCGIGDLLKKLSEVKPIYCFGIDISEKMIERAKKTHPFMNFAVGSGEKLPYKKAHFNLVTMVGVFHHIPTPLKTLQEIKSVLKEDGELIIGDFTLPIGIRDVGNLLLPLSHMGDVRVYNRIEIIGLLEQVGFKEIKWEQHGICFLVSAKSR